MSKILLDHSSTTSYLFNRRSVYADLATGPLFAGGIIVTFVSKSLLGSGLLALGGVTLGVGILVVATLSLISWIVTTLQKSSNWFDADPDDLKIVLLDYVNSLDEKQPGFKRDLDLWASNLINHDVWKVFASSTFLDTVLAVNRSDVKFMKSLSVYDEERLFPFLKKGWFDQHVAMSFVPTGRIDAALADMCCVALIAAGHIDYVRFVGKFESGDDYISVPAVLTYDDSNKTSFIKPQTVGLEPTMIEADKSSGSLNCLYDYYLGLPVIWIMVFLASLGVIPYKLDRDGATASRITITDLCDFSKRRSLTNFNVCGRDSERDLKPAFMHNGSYRLYREVWDNYPFGVMETGEFKSYE